MLLPDTKRLPELNRDRLDSINKAQIAEVFSRFIDAGTTATNRATFYNSVKEQEAALEAIHDEMFSFDRGVYSLCLILPGLTDYSRQLGMVKLLSSPSQDRKSVLNDVSEFEVVSSIAKSLPPQRMIKAILKLKNERVNNSRTRRIIFRELLLSPKLEFWSVKYRRKLRDVLRHLMGARTAGILKSILSKRRDIWNEKEKSIVRRKVERFIPLEYAPGPILECVSFILGNENEVSLKLLRAFVEAKTDLEAGRELPFEVLDGIRSRYHKDRKRAEALEMTRRKMSEGQKMALHRSAKKEGVKINFDPSKQSSLKLYLYAYEMGMTDEISKALVKKAEEVSRELPLRLGKISVLIDTSASMAGSGSQKLRPIASSLAVRDVLAEVGEEVKMLTSTGKPTLAGELLKPGGETYLASSLVGLLKEKPEVVFVITDGYENAPAGRTAEVVNIASRFSRIPIIQLSPVMASEAGGLRALSPEISTMPVADPRAIPLAMLKAAFAIDCERALKTMVGLGRKVLRLNDNKNMENKNALA